MKLSMFELMQLSDSEKLPIYMPNPMSRRISKGGKNTFFLIQNVRNWTWNPSASHAFLFQNNCHSLYFGHWTPLSTSLPMWQFYYTSSCIHSSRKVFSLKRHTIRMTITFWDNFFFFFFPSSVCRCHAEDSVLKCKVFMVLTENLKTKTKKFDKLL